MAGIYVSVGPALVEDVLIDNIGNASTPALQFGAGVNMHAINVECRNGGGILTSAGDGSSVVGCVAVDPDGYGIKVEGSTGGIVVANNSIKNASGSASVAALIVDGDGNGTRDVAVVGNTIDGGVDGIQIVDVSNIEVSGNNVKAYSRGIDLSAVSRSRISGNVVAGYSGIDVELTEHGIYLTGCSDNHITDNLVDQPGQGTNNTYDGIHLAGDSNRNFIAGNTIVPSAATNNTRYGINIGTATCDNNVVVGNNFGGSAEYGTGPFNNAGTGTVTTYAGGAVGDNVTY